MEEFRETNCVITSPDEVVEKAYDEILEKFKTLAAPSFALAASSSSSDYFTLRAPRQLREVNRKAFKPQIISIGPYHWGNKSSNLYKTMDIQKGHYLQKLLQRLASAADGGGREREGEGEGEGANNLDAILKSLLVMVEKIEEKARNCYEGRVNWMTIPEFVKMMVLDGLFVVELLRKFHNPALREENDNIFKQNSNLTIIAQDLFLLENQLPLFVLDLLFKETECSVPRNSEPPLLQDMASRFFSIMVPVPVQQHRDDGGGGNGDASKIKHLLSLVHNRCLPHPISPLQDKEDDKEYVISFGKLLDPWELELVKGRLKVIRSATRLREAGISFKKCRGMGNSLFDIKFENGVMHIPTLTVDHDTEKIFRNLIAYEQLHPDGSSIVMDYARLMDCLINYADDVALLSDSGIIDNMLGTNEDVADLFNKLNDQVYLSTANFYYSKLFQEVNKHCKRPFNLMKVKLKQKYFNNPWYWILGSIAAALFLLLLTVTQTLYSVLSYYKTSN